RRGRQRGDEAASVSFRTNPRVEPDEDAAVAAVTDEAAEPLLQCKDGERHLVIAERVAAAGADRFDARRGDRIGRRRERQLVDDDAAERFTDDVDALPEARRREQYRMRRRAELLQQLRSRQRSLREDGIV